MNSKVHPLVAALVVALAIAAIAIWMWGSGMASALGGPAAMVTGPDGHHFIQIQNYLIEHDEEGGYLRTHELRDLGVELFLGGFGVFSNGDVLMRRGPDPRSVMDNLRAFRRATNRDSTEPQTDVSGLFRCNLETSTCVRFGKVGVDFKATFSVYVDRVTDEVYIGDTTRHLLRKYAADGQEIAPPVGGFRFPNHLQVVDGQLLVADTNNHAIRIVDGRTETFGRSIDSIDVVPGAARAAGRHWPSHFLGVGDRWWVNNMQNAMDRGGLYVFDSDWRFLYGIDLPRNADPIALLLVGEEVWVSDWNNDVVHRLSVSGDMLPVLASPGLEAVLEVSRSARRDYRVKSYAGAAIFVLVFLALFVRAFAVSMNRNNG